MTLTMTTIKPERVALFDETLDPLLDRLIGIYEQDLPIALRPTWGALTPAERRVAVTLPILYRLLQRAADVGGQTYQLVLDDLGGEVWARSLDLAHGLAESGEAREAGRVL